MMGAAINIMIASPNADLMRIWPIRTNGFKPEAPVLIPDNFMLLIFILAFDQNEGDILFWFPLLS